MNHEKTEALLRTSLLKIQSLRSEVKALKDESKKAKSLEPIAIISMACRAPGGVVSPDDYWQLLKEGRDAVGPFPQRWNPESVYDSNPQVVGKSYVREAGIIDGVEFFDANFFGIPAQEAMAMDPQQRVALEVVWEVLERVGILPETLNETMTGVYMGLMGSDYALETPVDALSGYFGTGSSGAVLSGRISYLLGLHGPSITANTACSSSLVATHLACSALRQGECDIALAGGVEVMCTARQFVEFSRLRGMAPDGRCKSFSDNADGAGWSEGCGVLLLKRLSDAQRDGDTVLALINGSAVNQDGRSQGLTAPNGPSQQRVVQQALAVSSLKPADIDAIEAHGTGTALGDPIEAGALAEVFGPTRNKTKPVWLGSSKSNLGHTQAAAGVLGMIKMVLALVHEQLPKTLYADKASTKVAWENSGLRLLQKKQPWPRTSERARRGGVSSFGISGTNAHVILEEAPLAIKASSEVPETHGATGDSPIILPPTILPIVLSAKSEEALRENAARLAAFLAPQLDNNELAPKNTPPKMTDLSYSLLAHRTAFSVRLAMPVTADDAQAGYPILVEALTAFSATGRTNNKSYLTPSAHQDRQLAMLFSCQGGQRVAMGKELYGQPGLETFTMAFDAAVKCFDACLGGSLTDVIWGAEIDGDIKRLHKTQYTQPALFTLEIALYRQWEFWGVVPNLLLGHSIGELAAAHVAGVLSLKDAATLVTAHGGLLGGVTSSLSESLTAQENHIDSMLENFSTVAKQLTFHPPHISVVSSVTGKVADTNNGDLITVDYWVRHVQQAVRNVEGDQTLRFEDGVQTLVDTGVTTFLECGPDNVLCALAKDCLTKKECLDIMMLPSLSKHQVELSTLVSALGGVHVHGHGVHWGALFKNVEAQRITLPTYAFQRERYWLESTKIDTSAIKKTINDAALVEEPGVEGVGIESGGSEISPFVSQLKNTLPIQRKGIVIDMLQHQIMDISDSKDMIVDLNEGFSDLGFDSIMAINLRESVEDLLEIKLSSTLMFDYPNLNLLADYFLKLLDVDGVEQKNEAGNWDSDIYVSSTNDATDNTHDDAIGYVTDYVNSDASTHIELDDFGEEEIEDLLMKKLASLE